MRCGPASQQKGDGTEGDGARATGKMGSTHALRRSLALVRLVLQEGGLTPAPDSLGYVSEADRFVTDIAGVNKAERDVDNAKRERNATKLSYYTLRGDEESEMPTAQLLRCRHRS